MAELSPTFLLNLLTTVLGAAVLYYVQRNDKKTDAIAARLDNVDSFIKSELRVMDVRLARVEAHIWPSGKQQ